MRMFNGGPTALVLKVLASNTAKILGHIAKDTITTVSLLAALSVIHFGTKYTPASPEFIAAFTTVHEYCFLGTYLLLALKSLIRLARM
jgi:hypothetical protein